MARFPRVPTFKYPISEHTLDGWKTKVAVDSYGAIALAQAMGHESPMHTSGR